MKRKLLTMTLAFTLAFFMQVKSSVAQDVDSFGSNDSGATASIDSTENSTSSSDNDSNSFSAPADGTGSGSTNPLSNVASKAKNFDVDAFLDNHSELIGAVIAVVVGLGVLALAFYVVVILPIRFLRWLFGGGKKNREKAGQGERIYADVIYGQDTAHPYAVREDVTERAKRDAKREKFSEKVGCLIFTIIIFYMIAKFAIIAWGFANGFR